MRILLAGLILFSMFYFAPDQARSEVSARDDVEQELKRLENEWLNSYLRGDKQTFERIVADDFTRTDETGNFATKAEEKKTVQAPPASVSASLTNEDVQVRVYGERAVVT